MKAHEIMTRQVVTVQPDTPVGEIARLLNRDDISGVPVVDHEGAVVGIITELDLILRNARLHFPTYIRILDSIIYLQDPRRYQQEIRRALGTTANEIMTREVISASPEADVEDIATLMVDKRVNPIPILQDGQLVGIISRADLIRLMVRDLDQEEPA
ncbi:MAG: CBS domain-containing protein [Chloroflexi bacterium]|nr:CBS domain-containing protein [Chloroflexota bacterium]MBU1747074.1 CBS domain-containing protein [Chloroflexota bacterium]